MTLCSSEAVEEAAIDMFCRVLKKLNLRTEKSLLTRVASSHAFNLEFSFLEQEEKLDTFEQ